MPTGHRRCAAQRAGQAACGVAGQDVAPPDPFAPLAALLGPSELWFRRDELRLDSEVLQGETEVALVSHEDALDHIDPVEGAAATGAPGLWISDRFAESTALSPGSQTRLVVSQRGLDRGVEVERQTTVDVPIAGIYHNLVGAPPDRYWCSQADLLSGDFGQFLPPMLVADPATYMEIVTALG